MPASALPLPSGTAVVLPVLTEVAGEVTALERMIVAEEWLPASHVARYGARARDRKDAMVPVWRGWQSLQSTMRAGSDQTDLTHLRSALIELAAATVKFVADIDCHLTQNAPLAVDADEPLAGRIPPAGGRGGAVRDEPEDE